MPRYLPPAIEALESRLSAMARDGLPVGEMAARWREAYAHTDPPNRHAMHQVAHDIGLGAETGEEWILDRDITDSGSKDFNLQGLRADRYYRGFVLSAIVSPGAQSGGWCVEVATYDYRHHRVHKAEGSSYPSLAAAFAGGMRIAKNEVDRLKVDRQPPAGIDPAAYILGE